MNAALEYNDRGCMLFSLDCPGVFARGKTPEEAAARLPEGVTAYCRWAGLEMPDGPVTITEKKYQPGPCTGGCGPSGETRSPTFSGSTAERGTK